MVAFAAKAAVQPCQQYPPLAPYSAWLLLPLSIVTFVGAALLSLRMPAAPARAPVGYRGHPVTGPVVMDERVGVS